MSKEMKKSKRRAVALRYQPGFDDAPVIVGSGEGYAADRIIERAGEFSIPVVRDPEVSGALSHFAVGDSIPPQLYEAVAQILVFLAQMDDGYGQELQQAGRKTSHRSPE